MEEVSAKFENLVRSLDHADKIQIRKTVDAMLELVREFPELATRLETLLADDETNWPLAYVLGHVQHPSPLAKKVLLTTLKNDDPEIRWAIVLLLSRLAKNDPALAGLLLDLLHGESATQRRMALYCLRELDPGGAMLLQALRQAVHDAEPLVRVAAVTTMKNQPALSEEGAFSLIDLLLHDADSRVRCAAALALAHLPQPIPAAHQALKEACQSDNLHVRKACQTALRILEIKKPVPPTR
jgi:HEAT repeat protein